jgi:Domain of unknown function (DUF4249)
MKKIIVIVSIVFGFASCKNAFDLNQIVTIKSPALQNALVPNCIFNNGGAPLMSLTRNADINDSPSVYTALDTAIVQVTENGLAKNNLKRVEFYNPNSGFMDNYYYQADFTPIPNNVYSVKVSLPNFPTCTATDTMPSLVPFAVTLTGSAPKYIAVEMHGPGGGNSQIDTFVEISIKFTDMPGNDYYRIAIADSSYNNEGFHGSELNFGQGGGRGRGNLISNDIIFSSLNGGVTTDNFVDPNTIFFTDETFNGKTKDVRFYIPIGMIDKGGPWGNQPPFETAFIWLQHLSRQSYFYNIALQAYQNSVDNPFAQPSLLYTNYINGYGILGCVTSSAKSIKLK